MAPLHKTINTGKYNMYIVIYVYKLRLNKGYYSTQIKISGGQRETRTVFGTKL